MRVGCCLLFAVVCRSVSFVVGCRCLVLLAVVCCGCSSLLMAVGCCLLCVG